MKPTKMRNRRIYRASQHTRSKQLGGMLSKSLREKYGKRSVRVCVEDSVTIVRGEFKGVSGRVSKVFTSSSRVAINGVKKEKTKAGEKFDVLVHASNLVVTSLATGDKWRMLKIVGSEEKVDEMVKEEEEKRKEEDASGIDAQLAAAETTRKREMEDEDLWKADDNEEDEEDEDEDDAKPEDGGTRTDAPEREEEADRKEDAQNAPPPPQPSGDAETAARDGSVGGDRDGQGETPKEEEVREAATGKDMETDDDTSSSGSNNGDSGKEGGDNR